MRAKEKGTPFLSRAAGTFRACPSGLSGERSLPCIQARDASVSAMNIKDRIGTLRNRWQAAEKVFRTAGHEAYEREAREIYGLMREAWEQATSEVLLKDVVQRYRPSVETKKVRCLYDITEEDCRTLENGMTECSRWIRGHDHAAADGSPFPQPADLRARIDELANWVQGILNA